MFLIGCLLLTFSLAIISEESGAYDSNVMLLAYSDELKNVPSNPYPYTADVSDRISFYLYKRGNNERKELFPDSLKTLWESDYNPKLPTKIVIHGFLDNSEKTMPQSIKNSLLDQEDVNVILVDWGAIAISIDYIGIAKKTPQVGAYTAKLIDYLVKNGAKIEDFHLIGHSLGAHVAGFAGAAVKKGKIGRITGLDPAKPGFHQVSPGERLDPSDAQFVDCIHTCSGMLGLAEPICTADFYPNGGINVQPGCHIFDFGRCSHIRSFQYFNESIKLSNIFPTSSCSSVPTNKKRDCHPSNDIMGYYCPSSARGIYYAVTDKKPPFTPKEK